MIGLIAWLSQPAAGWLLKFTPDASKNGLSGQLPRVGGEAIGDFAWPVSGEVDTICKPQLPLSRATARAIVKK
jgi:hypothetical protein